MFVDTRILIYTYGQQCMHDYVHTCTHIHVHVFVFLSHAVRTFIELTFTILGVTVFLSEKLSQNPLEKLFGCQHQRGGTGDDPTVAEFVKNTNALRVVGTVFSRGNCQGNKESFDREKENTPLPKRRRYHK